MDKGRPLSMFCKYCGEECWYCTCGCCHSPECNAKRADEDNSKLISFVQDPDLYNWKHHSRKYV